jgi:predicted nuclease with TOPRIM domain
LPAFLPWQFNVVATQLNQALAKAQELDNRLINAQRKMNQQSDYLDTVETLRRQLEQATAQAMQARQRESTQEERVRELEDTVGMLSASFNQLPAVMLTFFIFSAELNAHIRRLEARVSEVPIDVTQLEEMRRANDRLRGELQRKTERIATLEQNATDLETTLSRLKEMTEMTSEAQDEIASLKRQLELKSKSLEQANESLRVAVSVPRQRAMTTFSADVARASAAADAEDLSSPTMDGIAASSLSSSSTVEQPFQHTTTSSTPMAIGSSIDDLSSPNTPVGSLSSSYRSESSMIGYDPSAAFLEQQQKLAELNRKLEETAERLAEKSEEQKKLQELNEQLKETATLLQAKSEQINANANASAAASLVPAEPPKPVTKEGFMTKEGAFIKSWKRRFFFMESEALYYAADIKTRFVTRGAIELRGARIHETNVANRICSFSILTPTRTYFLQCDSEQDKAEWIAILRARIAQIGAATAKKL